MKQRYQIITIYEEDHGCEGIPEGEEKGAKSIGQELGMLFC